MSYTTENEQQTLNRLARKFAEDLRAYLPSFEGIDMVVGVFIRDSEGCHNYVGYRVLEMDDSMARSFAEVGDLGNFGRLAEELARKKEREGPHGE